MTEDREKVDLRDIVELLLRVQNEEPIGSSHRSALDRALSVLTIHYPAAERHIEDLTAGRLGRP